MILFLTYHKIRSGEESRENEFYTVSLGQLVRQLDALAAAKIPCVAAATLLEQPTAASVVYILSFDDATSDHYEVVFVLLQERGLRAVFFVPTSKLNRPGRLTNAQVREMARAGHTIGLHGHEHKRLDFLSDDNLREQMSGSQKILSDLTGEKPWIFAPPGGFMNEHVREVALGFGARIIRTMRWGYNQALDLSAMETIPINRYTDDRKFLKIIEARQSRFFYVGKQAAKALIPARAYERLRGRLFKAAGKQ